MRNYTQLIFEVSQPGRRAYRLPEIDVEEKKIEDMIPQDFLRVNEAEMPEVSEVDVIRHYTNISNKNYGVDTGFYPLGSCTMKYNPKINEDVASMPGLSALHPYQPEETVQGSLEIMFNLQSALAEIGGMDKTTLQPAAGAQGELTGIMIVKAYHQKNGDFHRTKIIAPDSSHGTNPATVAVAGFEIVEIKSKKDGSVDMDALKEAIDDNLAGLMLTNPSTLGLFETQIKEIADLIHENGGLLYYDGANMNAIMGKTRPGDMGFDIMHYNLHKTFSTPHGGGGPGAGPVCVKEYLAEFLPKPAVIKKDGNYTMDYDRPNSIGKIKGFYGNYGILVRAYTYILTLGRDGLKFASETAVLNANYMMNQLKKYYKLPMDQVCKHEFVLGGLDQPALAQVTTLDVAKRLLDFGYHPPTIYFPMIVHEAIMIEPTETESKETLDQFIAAMIRISEEAKEDPNLLKNAPYNTPVRRVNEVLAAKQLILKYKDSL